MNSFSITTMIGDMFRLAGQEEAYDQIKKLVLEQGLVEAELSPD